mmetsp:Transcript_4344/g.10450  ORF Transcript_4344/g.10450 Transcript_4344/m.10450 type:complete len:226 (-) Transcript_4344:726-1403(-)
MPMSTSVLALLRRARSGVPICSVQFGAASSVDPQIWVVLSYMPSVGSSVLKCIAHVSDSTTCTAVRFVPPVAFVATVAMSRPLQVLAPISPPSYISTGFAALEPLSITNSSASSPLSIERGSVRTSMTVKCSEPRWTSPSHALSPPQVATHPGAVSTHRGCTSTPPHRVWLVETTATLLGATAPFTTARTCPAGALGVDTRIARRTDMCVAGRGAVPRSAACPTS